MARRRDWIVGVIIGVSALLVLMLIAMSLVGTMSQSGFRTDGFGQRIALVEVLGPILRVDPVVQQLARYTEDEEIPAIVLRIDSPGGGVAASQEIYRAVLRAREYGKRVVASMGSVAASGGYYIAAAADTIVANPGTLTGSIGVIMRLFHMEEVLDRFGLRFETIQSGKYKDTGSISRDMTEDERILLQAVIDDVYGQFVDAIVEMRGIEREGVLEFADGRIFTGGQALEYGLVDLLGDYQDAIDLAAEMVGMERNPPIVKERTKVLDILDLLLQRARSALSVGSGPRLSLQYMLAW